MASKEAAISVNFQDELENESGAGIQSGVVITNPETAIEADEKENAVKMALFNLPTIERNILLAHYGFNGNPMSMREIAENFKLTTQQVKVYHQNAINALYNCKELDAFANKESREHCLFDNLLFFPVAEEDSDDSDFDFFSFGKEGLI